ncbi:hypothetical protein IIJ62_004420 [Salmonella enterica subsp. enterica serovar Chester]|nr:hypothetical protein [Salmonella enterica]EEI5477319.1 hypothetical protein [Salmonella enterica subsp. enterica serovar Chester]EGM3650061.1 hypothetical protein [Salmonella enterica subsp. enterica serovar Chester]
MNMNIHGPARGFFDSRQLCGVVVSPDGKMICCPVARILHGEGGNGAKNHPPELCAPVEGWTVQICRSSVSVSAKKSGQDV